MDFHSIEFYIIALFVAFALIGPIFGTTARGPARIQIMAFDLSETSAITFTALGIPEERVAPIFDDVKTWAENAQSQNNRNNSALWPIQFIGPWYVKQINYPF